MAQERNPAAYASCNCARSAASSSGLDELAAGAHSLRGFDHALVQHFGKHDMPVEQPRPGLGRDPQRIAKAARDDQQSAFALALQQRVGRHGGAHLDAGHALRRDRLPGANPSSRRIPSTAASGYCDGFSDSSFSVCSAPIRRASDDVGERASPIDPKLPAAAHGKSNCAFGFAARPSSHRPSIRRPRADSPR